MVFNSTFNNISVISLMSALLVEETGGPGENHRPDASHWQTFSHNVVSSSPRLSGIRTNTQCCQFLWIVHSWFPPSGFCNWQSRWGNPCTTNRTFTLFCWRSWLHYFHAFFLDIFLLYIFKKIVNINNLQKYNQPLQIQRTQVRQMYYIGHKH